MDQTERIFQMERYLDASDKAIRELNEALAAYEETQPLFLQLNEYYGSELWMRDLEDDEAGKLPRDLKRGVLSEDGIYDLIQENRELLERMLRLVTAAMGSDKQNG